MKKPYVGQQLIALERERFWGNGGGYKNNWYLVNVTKVGRVYYYTKRAEGWDLEQRQVLEYYGTRYSSFFETAEDARKSFTIGIARDLLRKVRVNIEYYSNVTDEQATAICYVFPGLGEELNAELDKCIQPVLDLIHQTKEEVTNDNRNE